jgi:hypothetical protein
MAYNKRLAKPLLVITVTDGEPSDKPADKIFSVIQECVNQMSRAGYGPHAVAFQFAQVHAVMMRGFVVQLVCLVVTLLFVRPGLALEQGSGRSCQQSPAAATPKRWS